MSEDKKFTFDKEMLEDQREKVKDLIKYDKEVMAENDTIAKDPSHIR